MRYTFLCVIYVLIIVPTLGETIKVVNICLVDMT